MTIKHALKNAIKNLKKHNVSNPELDAEILLSSIINKPQSYLYAHSEEEINWMQNYFYTKKVIKRCNGIPIAYITGEKNFYNLTFNVNKHVLIPRPETEILVEETLKVIDKYNKQVNIADIGTGSGNIALSILKNSHKIYRMYATDISRKALKVAKKNTKKNNITRHIIFKHGNLLRPLHNIPLEIIVCNLPYVSYQDYLNNPDLKFEPVRALTDKRFGISIFKNLFKQLHYRNQKPDYILLEIGHNQADIIKKLAEKNLDIASFSVIKDYGGRDRVVKIRLK